MASLDAIPATIPLCPLISIFTSWATVTWPALMPQALPKLFIFIFTLPSMVDVPRIPVTFFPPLNSAFTSPATCASPLTPITSALGLPMIRIFKSPLIIALLPPTLIPVVLSLPLILSRIIVVLSDLKSALVLEIPSIPALA